ncbi:TniQ family protein [uncultured Sulfitobacter sp.]|uniref:TniQ family protein n=1 Tax=uncultured Sulfitobacter sp. TaxID=191468 RepID=UPI002624FF09|nr:TniQ family protein [uncultured Sulfitobacter sp.]
MALLPVLPLISGESLTSYVNRVAAFHCNLTLEGFLKFFEISQQALLSPGLETLDRISDLTGQHAEELAKMSFLRAGSRQLTINGEAVHSEFMDLSSRPLCPECLLEDIEGKSASGGLPVGRLEWQMQPVRVCGKHSIVLQAQRVTKYSDRLRLLPELSVDRTVLESMMASVVQQQPSLLQKYVTDRIAGNTGSEWLDGQPLDLAARACEMLGIIHVVGTHVDLRAVSEAQRSEAGDLGFSYAADGVEGVHACLQVAFDRYVSKNLKGGPQMAFGRFYQWLQFNKNNRPAGPIRDVAREFILDHFPIEAGANLMGAIVDKQRFHSVYSLARKTGDHPKTINRAVILIGLAEGDLEKASASIVFDAEAAESLMDRVRTSISVSALKGYLNCNRVQAQQLAQTGMLPRLLPEGRKSLGVLTGIAREDADEFLDKLMGAAESVTSASEGMSDIVAAAETSRWPAMDIVRGILSGLFKRVEVVNPELKFKGILVDPVEVRMTLKRNQLKGCVGIEEAVQLIGMPQQGLNNLLRMRNADGVPYITERLVNNAKGVSVRLFALDEIRAFRRDYVSLTEIAEAEECYPKIMKVKLDDRGLVPVAPRYELGRVWYRRADLKVA